MNNEVMARIESEKLIAIVRGAKPEQCLSIAHALYDGGIRLMEVTYNQANPDSWISTAEAIHAIKGEFAGRMCVGAGTVTNTHLVDLTHAHGGQYIISPDTNVSVIKKTKELGMISMPGAMTPSEVITAHNAGADIVKLFPASDLGPGYLKAVRAPLNHIKIMAVGGINQKNMPDFLAAGACGFGVGGNLANSKWIESGEFEKITNAAIEIVRTLHEALKEKK